jgi:hypothetical protein
MTPLCDQCIIAQMLFLGNLAGAGIIFTNLTILSRFTKKIYDSGPKKIILLLGLIDGLLLLIGSILAAISMDIKEYSGSLLTYSTFLFIIGFFLFFVMLIIIILYHEG